MEGKPEDADVAAAIRELAEKVDLLETSVGHAGKMIADAIRSTNTGETGLSPSGTFYLGPEQNRRNPRGAFRSASLAARGRPQRNRRRRRHATRSSAQSSERSRGTARPSARRWKSGIGAKRLEAIDRFALETLHGLTNSALTRIVTTDGGQEVRRSEGFAGCAVVLQGAHPASQHSAGARGAIPS